jgi:sugar O-acyltransferase (sialic acid O-acetyltransferase NeuD family)
MKKKIIILGAGGALFDILEILKLLNLNDFEIYDDKKKTTKKIKIYGSINQAIKKYKNKKNCFFVFGFGTAKTTNLRKHIFNKFRLSAKKLITLIHPNASVSKYSRIGNGCVIKSNATILPGAKIGYNVIISQLCSVSHDVKIGSHCILAPSSSCSGGSQIGNSSFLGTNCTINENIKIGQNSIIGLGSKVIKSLKKNSIFYEKTK